MLQEADLRKMERVAVDVETAGDVRAYAEAAVMGLLQLIPTDLSYTFCELRQEPFVKGLTFESSDTGERPELDEALARYWRQSPTSSISVGARGGVFRWSDLIARQDLERLDIYQQAFHPRGEDHVVKVAFRSQPLESHAIMLCRTGSDFDDREVAMLRVLYPTLRAARDALRARASARALEDVLNAGGIGVIHLRRGATSVDLLGSAEAMLREWFQHAGTSLPATIEAWLASQLGARPLDPGEPLVLRRGDRTLSIRLLRAADAGEPDQLLLQQRQAHGSDDVARSLGLTSREIEVLRHVARGMTNQEVAETLFLAPTTVRRHLENIFSKLGTRTRTAAVAKAFPR